MAKKKQPKKKPAESERYVYVRAIVDCGNLSWEYQLEGGPEKTESHDEDIEHWTDDDIIKLTRSVLCMQPDEKVEVFYS